MSDDERDLAQNVLSAVLGYTANAVSEMTHDIIWDAAEDGEEIPMYATLVSETKSLNDEIKDWARPILEEERRDDECRFGIPTELSRMRRAQKQNLLDSPTPMTDFMIKSWDGNGY